MGPHIQGEEVIPELRGCPVQALTGAESDIGNHSVESVQSLGGFADQALALSGITNVSDYRCRANALLLAEF